MDLRLPSVALAAGRVAFGAGLALAPAPFAGVWIGSRARDPRTQVLCRGFGVRDLVLGAGSLLSLRRSDFGRPRWWFVAQALSDTTDLIATLMAGAAIDPARRRIVASLAAGSALVAVAAAVTDVGGPASEPTLLRP